MTDNTEIQEIQLYDIREENMDKVQTRLDKLNKKASKLGCDPVSIVIHKSFLKIDIASLDQKTVKNLDKMTTSEKVDLPRIKFFTIEIIGSTIKLAGWKFLATLDHYSIPGEVIANVVPNESISMEIINNGTAICDHCNKVRNRKETFIVSHEDGDVKQIGRQCLKDFLGHNPAGIVTFMQMIEELLSDVDDDFGGISSGGYYYFETERVMSVTAAIIRNFGWTSKSAAQTSFDEVAPTSTLVAEYINPFDPKGHKEFVAEVALCDADVEVGKKAIAWLKEQDADNEYMHNIKAIASTVEFSGKLLGYACSIVSAYQRAIGELKRKEYEKSTKLNEWVKGEVKDKIELTVTVTNIQVILGTYGAVDIHRFIDQDGRTVVWFSNSGSSMKEGETYKIKATIKKFDEYKDWKQTTLLRVKVI